jgi:Flp pilus assembly pilin Flp
MKAFFLQLLGRDTRGAVSTEYVVLVGTMGLTFAIALAAIGPVLFQNFYFTRAVVLSPIP